MNISMISMRDLEYLVAVGESEHFGRAALACNVSQPTLSSQVKKVEEILGVTIFERTNRSVFITEIGREILKKTQLILSEAKKLSEIGKRHYEPLDGVFRLGSIATVGPYLVPYFLRPLRKSYPKLELILKEGFTTQLIAELRQGRLDAVIASPTFDNTGLLSIPLYNEPFIFAAPADHILAKKAGVKIRDLKVEDMVLLEEGHCLKDQVIEICKSSEKGRESHMQSASLETLKQLVAAGMGYTVIPKLAVKNESGLKELITYHEFDSIVGRDIFLYCRIGYTKVRDIECLASEIKTHLPKGLRIIKG